MDTESSPVASTPATPLQRRRAPRVRSSLGVYCVLESEEVLPAMIRNLSISGAQVESKRPLAEGSRVTLRFSTERPVRLQQAVVFTMSVASEVVWCRQLREDARTFHFGVKFRSMSRRETESLVRFFFEQFWVRLFTRRHPTTGAQLTCYFADDSGAWQAAALRSVSVHELGMVSLVSAVEGNNVRVYLDLGEGIKFDFVGRCARCRPKLGKYQLTFAVEDLEDLQHDGLIHVVSRILHQPHKY